MKQTFTKLGGALFALLFLATSSASATITAKWDWKNNVPSTIRETPEVYRSSAWIASNVSGVSMFADATLDNSAVLRSNASNAHVQFNAKTQLRVPVVSTKDVVTVEAHSSSYNGIIIGNEDFDNTNTVRSHTATESDVAQGYVIIESKGGYLLYVQVELAYMPTTRTIANWSWKETTPASISSVSIQNKTDNVASDIAGISMFVDASAGKLNANGNNAQFNKGTILRIPVTATSDIVSVSLYPGSSYDVTVGAASTVYTVQDFSYQATAADVALGYVQITQGESQMQYIYSVTLSMGNYESVTIGSTGWATFSNASATDFTGLAGVVDAYQVTGNSGSAITKDVVTTAAAAGTGLLLNAAAGTYAIPLVASGTDLSATNKLKAVLTGETVSAAASGFTNFVLAGGSGTAVFKSVTGNNTANVGAGKAYLQLAGSTFAPQLFFDADVTGIGAVKSINKEDGAYYNLAGQRVAQPQKGLYIVNGKKVIIK